MSKIDMEERDYLFDWFKSVGEYYYIATKLEHNNLARSNFPNIWTKKKSIYFIVTWSIFDISLEDKFGLLTFQNSISEPVSKIN